MKEFKILSTDEEEKLNKKELKKYYFNLRNYYSNINKNNIKEENIHNLFNKLATKIRSYPIIKIYDEEENSIDRPVIFACNHSNSHDYYTVQELFTNMINVLVASDSLSPLTQTLFKASGSILINRDDKISCAEGINELVKKIVNGNDVLIFPESTWNIHPSKIMLPLKKGIIEVAAKSGAPIIPIIFEYVENNNLCSKEKEIYDACIIEFGRPIYVSLDDNYLEKLSELRNSMATLRWDIWSLLGDYKRKDLSAEIYFNHTELKCNTTLFKYNHIKEEKYIYGSNDYIYKDYPINRITPPSKILTKSKNK